MIKLHIDRTEIFINTNLIFSLGNFIPSLISPCKVLIISDSKVSNLYLDIVRKQFEKEKFQVETFVFESGEKSKNLKTVEKIYNILAENYMARRDIIIGLGGGVVTDIAGFVAATYKRGMKLIQIPTSLLAQIDASIGGKNAVNTAFSKNSVGTFYHADMVLIDPEVLSTLPRCEINSGMAEVIKSSCISDKELFVTLQNYNFGEDFEEIIHKTVLVKKEFVEKDNFDFSQRMMLNFGHTVGHALEKYTAYEKLSHGGAVSIGMNTITRLSEKYGMTKKGTSKELRQLCEKYSLPTELEFPVENIYTTILNDKKISNDTLNLILLKEIGKGFICKLSSDRILNFLNGEYVF